MEREGEEDDLKAGTAGVVPVALKEKPELCKLPDGVEEPDDVGGVKEKALVDVEEDLEEEEAAFGVAKLKEEGVVPPN